MARTSAKVSWPIRADGRPLAKGCAQHPHSGDDGENEYEHGAEDHERAVRRFIEGFSHGGLVQPLAASRCLKYAK